MEERLLAREATFKLDRCRNGGGSCEAALFGQKECEVEKVGTSMG